MSLSDTALVTLAQAKNFIRVDAATSLNVPAEYVGLGDGETVEFTLDNTPISGSLKLYVDGVLQVEDTDFTISEATITFTTAPVADAPITASYDTTAGDNTFESYDDNLLENLINAATKKAEVYTGRAFIQRSITESHNGDGLDILRLYRQPVALVTSVSYKKVVRKTGDGSTTAFALGNTPKSSSLTVYVDGVLQTVDEDYILSGSTVTFTSAPSDGAKIIFRYEVELDLADDYSERLHIGRLHGSWLENYEYVIVYTAGYAATRAATQALAPDAVTAILIAVATWYGNRMGVKSENVSGVGSVDYGEPGELPPASKRLLNSLKVSFI